jgi:hypothetical protein
MENEEEEWEEDQPVTKIQGNLNKTKQINET